MRPITNINELQAGQKIVYADGLTTIIRYEFLSIHPHHNRYIICLDMLQKPVRLYEKDVIEKCYQDCDETDIVMMRKVGAIRLLQNCNKDMHRMGMIDTSLKNRPITAIEDGKEYWISRSMAVSAFIFYEENGETYVLANKRGENAPDFKGKWNCPCGYLDFNETLKEAVIREVFEETGYRLSAEQLSMDAIADDPAENRQNVTARFTAHLDCKPVQEEPQGGEEDEVEEVAWINIKEIENYEWAFNHDKIIKSL